MFLSEADFLFPRSGNLEDEHVKKQYEKAYGILLNFFHEHM